MNQFLNKSTLSKQYADDTECLTAWFLESLIWVHSQLVLFQALWPLASYLVSPNISFLPWKMKITKYLLPIGIKVKWDDTLAGLHTVATLNRFSTMVTIYREEFCRQCHGAILAEGSSVTVLWKKGAAIRALEDLVEVGWVRLCKPALPLVVTVISSSVKSGQ